MADMKASGTNEHVSEEDPVPTEQNEGNSVPSPEEENFGTRIDIIFCGVFDGHGPYGHMVARRVRYSLSQKLSAHWEVNIGRFDFIRQNNFSTIGSSTYEENVSVFLDAESRDSSDLEEKDRDPEIFTTLKETFLKAFKIMDKELRLNRNIDCFCSGTTAVTLVKQPTSNQQVRSRRSAYASTNPEVGVNGAPEDMNTS